ncbi:MAG: glycosyltransferase family 39 protein [Victivallales bacterium]|nr:glycosyltransferase family 39 protein [Victivallales bacterium]
MKDKPYKCLLLLAVLLALLLRLVASVQMYGLPAVQNPSPLTDMATYLRLAGEISSGNWPDHFDYQPFYYSIFLPFCRFFGGTGIVAAITIQVLLGAAGCLLVGLSAQRLFGKRVGFFAALILAISKMHVFYTPFMLFEVLQSFWIALLLWLALVAWEKNRIWHWLVLSLLLGIATLTRGNALLFLPGILAFYLVRNARKGAIIRVVSLALLMTIIFELPQLPYSIRNYKYAGRWCGASTAGGKVLALGNTPEAPPGGLEYPLTYSRWVALDEARPEDGHVSMVSNILCWAVREPLVFLDLKWRAALLFWDRREIPNNVSLEHEGRACPWLSALPPFAITGSLAFLGLLFLLKGQRQSWRERNPQFAPCLFFMYMLLCSWFATALFYNLARFRITSLPLMAIAAGYALDMLVDKIARRKELKRDEGLALALCGIVSIFAVCFLYGFWEENMVPAIYRIARPNGLLCQFPDTSLLYDHGPFTVGGFSYLQAPRGGIAIKKQLCIPSGTRNVKVRIPVMLGGAPCSATLTCDGRKYQLGPNNLVQDRFLQWLEQPIDEVKSGDFVFELPEGLGFGVDTSRDYGRTHLATADGTNEVFTGEAAIEAQW